MGELVSNQSLRAEPSVNPSLYARMIPGVSATPHPEVATAASAAGGQRDAQSIAGVSCVSKRRTRSQTSIQKLLPQPTGDRFVLFQLIGTDLILLTLTCIAALSLFPRLSLSWSEIPIFGVLVTLFSFSEGAYRSADESLPPGAGLTLLRSTVFATGLVLIATRDEFRPLAAFTTFASNFTVLIAWRRWKEIARTRHHRKSESRNVLIVGGGPVARSIAHSLRNDPLHRATVRGFVDDNLPLSPVVLGRIADLEWLARAEFIDEVILALPGELSKAREAAEVAFRNHLDIRAVPDLPPGPWPDSGLDRIGEVPVVTLHRELLPCAGLFLKHLLDVGAAALCLGIVSPLMAIIALLIRMDSPGPVIYSAERIGAEGRRFRCYKFRSMVTDAAQLKEDLRAKNERLGPIFKIDNDPRITRIGRIIRRYSLDELPQLWNVLCGDMSLVGPRPHPIDDVNRYELHHYRRLDVKPGITGLWQVTARDCPSFELNMHLDLTYIENWNLGLDLRILATTVRVLFAPEGV